MPYFVQVRKADDVVVQIYSRRRDIAERFSNPDLDQIEIDATSYSTLRAAGLYFEGTDVFRWVFDRQSLEFNEIADARPVATFTPNTVIVERGQAAVVQMALARADGDHDLTINGRVCRLTFAGGVATVALDTSSAGLFAVGPHPDFQVARRLVWTVYLANMIAG